MHHLISLFPGYSAWRVRPLYGEADPVVWYDACVRPRWDQGRHPRSPRPKCQMRLRKWRALQDRPKDKTHWLGLAFFRRYERGQIDHNGPESEGQGKSTGEGAEETLRPTSSSPKSLPLNVVLPKMASTEVPSAAIFCRVLSWCHFFLSECHFTRASISCIAASLSICPAATAP